MKQNGVVPQVDAVVDTSVQFNMMAGAFTGGQGDYVTLFEPTATEVERAGHGYVVLALVVNVDAAFRPCQPDIGAAGHHGGHDLIRAAAVGQLDVQPLVGR